MLLSGGRSVHDPKQANTWMDLSHRRQKSRVQATRLWRAASWGFRCKTTAGRDEQLRFWRFRNVRTPFNGFWFQGVDITLESATDKRHGNSGAGSRTTRLRYFGRQILPDRVPDAWTEVAWLINESRKARSGYSSTLMAARTGGCTEYLCMWKTIQ